MKTEADLTPEFIKPEGYLSDRELVVPSLMPFLTEDTLNMTMLKRNLHEEEKNKQKINQKKIELEFGSSILLDTSILLEEWSYLVRDDEDLLTCPIEWVLPTIFSHFHELNDVTIGLTGKYFDNDVIVPIFGKPKTLRQAFNVYQNNSETIKKLSQGWRNLLDDILSGDFEEKTI